MLYLARTNMNQKLKIMIMRILAFFFVFVGFGFVLWAVISGTPPEVLAQISAEEKQLELIRDIRSLLYGIAMILVGKFTLSFWDEK